MKLKRQMKILEIIKNEEIETQDDLTEALRENGFDVTQATVCRDIKELGLIKIQVDQERSKYAIPETKHHTDYLEKAKKIFRDFVLGIDSSENMIVIKTFPGHAQAVAATIDALAWKEIIGTVAGDDTILLIVKFKDNVLELVAKFQKLF